MENEEIHPVDVSPGHLDLSEGDEANLTVADADYSAGPLSESRHYVTEASSGPKENIIQGVSHNKFNFLSWLPYLNSTNGTDADSDILEDEPEDPEKAKIRRWLIVCVALIVAIMVAAYVFKLLKSAWRTWPRSPLRRRLGALFPNWFPEISDDPLLEPQEKANIAHASTGSNNDENAGTSEVKKGASLTDEVSQEATQIKAEGDSQKDDQTEASEAEKVAAVDNEEHVPLEEGKKDVERDAHSPAKKDAEVGATDDAQQLTKEEAADNAQAEAHHPAKKDTQAEATDAQQVTKVEATDDTHQVAQADAQQLTKGEAADNTQAEALSPAKKDTQAETTDAQQLIQAEAADIQADAQQVATDDAQQVVQAETS
nr:uncharacterized protein LOC123756837 [Procambarus clarkii]XP_045596166.1 uncharacterized protein LOC123756837 [Procambarus clarkii]XP_045596167.1 uncharacterized protein LOC123756837 [Procambarus clarkii]XP_045596168.1 uncharacterized protein LOC123756837 [Procambarus clarkii]XP_045596169.1 uncharacterized protein LOC123756837 [Procambarus clarkii]